MVRWLGAVPAKPPKQKLFGDKPKYLPGFGGTPGSGPPAPPAEPPKKSTVSGGWVAVGAIALVVGAAWYLTGGKSLFENPAASRNKRLARACFGGGYEIHCADSTARGFPYNNRDDAVSDAQSYSRHGVCRSRGCPGGKHSVVPL